MQVGNTFHEQKLYLIHPSPFRREGDALGDTGALAQRVRVPPFYRSQPVKEFYVSPFGKLEDHFDFRITLPDAHPGAMSHPKQLAIFVDTLTPEHRVVLTTSLQGQAMPMESWGLVKMGLRYPLSTLMVIARIHYQALLLFIKGIPFFKKEHQRERQTQVLNPHASLKGHG